MRKNERQVYGSKGSLEAPATATAGRSSCTWTTARSSTTSSILEYAPSYKLEPLAAELFGGERVWTYSFDFNDTDSQILALEYHELGECIRTGAQPEVTGEEARADVALAYAPFEAGRLGRPVTLDDMISGRRRRLPARDRRDARARERSADPSLTDPPA